MGWAILAALAVLAALPWLLERRRRPVDAVLRRAAPGQFAPLSGGVTHYQWIGPARGPVAVGVHGLTTPSPAWHAVARELGAVGYRVLIYDLYGRGYSDRPRERQNRDHFLRQLQDLLDHERIGGDITLMGYSMGGAIATAYAAENPHKIKRLILFAPAGVIVPEGRMGWFMRQVPGLGDWLFHTLAAWQLWRGLRASRGQPTEVAGIADLQLAEFSRRGFWPSVLSSLRFMLRAGQETEHRQLARDGVPVVALWGRDDGVIPLACVGRLAEWNRNARQDVVDGAGHGLPYTHASAVIGRLKELLRD